MKTVERTKKMADKLIGEKSDRGKPSNARAPSKGKPGTNGKPASPHPGETSDPWPDAEPIPNGLPGVMPFDYTMLPHSFFDFVNDVAERMQCPPDFPGVAIMVALAAVVGKKIGIRPKRHDDWLVVPNLWGAIIGRPGVMKTPTIQEALQFLRRLEQESKKEHEEAIKAYEIQKVVALEENKQRASAVSLAIKNGRNAEEAAREIAVSSPIEPTRKRKIVNDATVEKLGDLLNQNPNGLLVYRDELSGLLENLDREGQEGARAFYLECWDGKSNFTVDRMSRGTLEIGSALLSVFGGIQPGALTNVLRGAVQGGGRDDGLMQRFQLAVYPDVPSDWRNVDRFPDSVAKRRVWETFQRLDAITAVDVSADLDGPIPFLRFEADAQNVYDEWRSVWEPRVRSGNEHPAVESHFAKYRSLVPTLALLIHLADEGRGPVTAGAIQKALAWATYLESHARRIYSVVVDPANNAAKAIEKRIANGDLLDAFTLRMVYRSGWAGLQKHDAELAVELLCELGWLKEVETTTGGKPKTVFRIHPSVLRRVGQRDPQA